MKDLEITCRGDAEDVLIGEYNGGKDCIPNLMLRTQTLDLAKKEYAGPWVLIGEDEINQLIQWLKNGRRTIREAKKGDGRDGRKRYPLR